MKRLSKHLDILSHKITFGYIVVIFFIYVVFSLIVGGTGVIHNEMYLRMPVHLSGNPLIQILYDIKNLNYGGWEARHISYLFDVIDGNFIVLCVNLGFPHFRSFTHYLFTFLIMIFLWLSFTKDMKLNPLLSLILITLLLTTPSFIYSYYYRTSKIGVSLMSIIVLFGLNKFSQNTEIQNTKNNFPIKLILLFFFSTLALSFFDILGVLIAGVFTFYSFCIYFFRPNKTSRTIFLSIFIACVVWAVYFVWIGPKMMFYITGQKADTSFLTSTPFEDMPVFLAFGVPILLLDMSRFLLGYVTQAQSLIIFICIFAVIVWLDYRTKRDMIKKLDKKHSDLTVYALFHFVFLIGGLTIVYGLLITRHPAVLWPDIRPSYYIMPAQVILLFSLSALISKYQLKKIINEKALWPVLSIILVLVIVGNIIGSVKIHGLLFDGYAAKTYTNTNTPQILDAIENIHTPGYVPDSTITSDPIYQLLTNH